MTNIILCLNFYTKYQHTSLLVPIWKEEDENESEDADFSTELISCWVVL